MTDLTPAQAEAVRRALADARHTGPVPPEVAERLDATLQDLVAEREAPMVAAALASPDAAAVDAAAVDAAAPAAGPDRTGNVIPLWRRRLPAVLAAAAAVTAFAVVAPKYLGGETARPAGSAADARRESAPPDLFGTLSDAPAPLTEAAKPYATDSNSLNKLRRLDGQVLRLHDATIEEELAFLVDGSGGRAVLADSLSNSYDTAQRSPHDGAAEGRARCGPAELVEGSTVYAARYHRHPALVVVPPAPPQQSDAIEVDIYDCAAADPSVPARTVVLEAGN